MQALPDTPPAKPAWALAVLSGALVACGALDREAYRRDYRFLVQSDTPSVRTAFIASIERFDAELGAELLAVHEGGAEAVSVIQFRQLDLGVIAVTTSTYQDGGYDDRHKVQGMSVTFDSEWVAATLADDASGLELLFTAFSHEVGHGLEFRHVSDEADVMFPRLTLPKRWDAFYARVQAQVD